MSIVFVAACGGDGAPGAPADAELAADGSRDAGPAVDVIVSSGDASVDAAPPDPRTLALVHNGSFEGAAAGAPDGWTCSYVGEGTPTTPLCEVIEQGCAHGDRCLRIAPGVAAFRDGTLEAADQLAHLGFELMARRPAGAAAPKIQGASFYAFAHQGTDILSTVAGRIVHPAGADRWQRVESLTTPLDGATSVRVVLYNDDPAASLEVDDVIVTAHAEPRQASGHLLRAEHASSTGCAPSDQPTTIWLPLPLDHGVQVPLHLRLELAPQGVAAVTYETDALGNLGARITVPPSPTKLAFELRWTAVVLAREAKDPATLAELYAAKLPPSALEQWLSATPVVDTTHPPLEAEVQQLVANKSSAEEKLEAILAWSSTFIDGAAMPTSLDAKSVYDSHAGTCTGYANLAAAAGRIAGVPTRTVANYLVGMPQQTHAIDELYLGPKLGWRLVEPQGTLTVLPADYAVVVRIVPPEDEQLLSLQGNHNWSAPGVPSRTLSHPIDGDLTRCSFGFASPAPFPSCPQCNNAASYQVPLLSPTPETVALFDRARTLWQAALGELVASGKLSPAEQQARAAALSATGNADVEALLTALETLP